MVCLDRLRLDAYSLNQVTNALNIRTTNIKYKKSFVIKACFHLPGLDYYLPLLTPLIIKFVFACLLFLILHLFYSLIPEKI